MQRFKFLYKVNSRVRNIYIFLASLVLIGVLSGSSLFAFLSVDDQTLVLNSINSYFMTVEAGEIEYWALFKNSIFVNFIMFTSMAVLGLSLLGAPLVCFFPFVKGFILGFMLSAILFKYKVLGIFLSIIYMFPHLIISMLLTMLLAFYALQFSHAIFKNIFGKRPVSLKNLFIRYIKVYGVCLVGGLIISCYEIFVVPNILRAGMLIFN